MTHLKDTLIALERSLVQSQIRTSVDQLDHLLSDDFLEIPASGIPFGKDHVLERLPGEQTAKFGQYHFQLRTLGLDCAQLVYQACIQRPGQPMQYSQRCSIWKRVSKGWQMSFHQGTPCPSFEL